MSVSKKQNHIENSNQTLDNAIELIDIQDIVPQGGNSIFLCISRSLIYYIYTNQQPQTLLESFRKQTGIDKECLKSDTDLQNALRAKLCEYWCKCVHEDANQILCLNEKYANEFQENIYDFLIQVYQASINNYSINHLMQKYLLTDLSTLLNVKIYFKKLNNDDWIIYEPNDNNCETTASKSKKQAFSKHDIHPKYSIYLRECRTEKGKNIRMLLPRTQWKTNQMINQHICGFYFTQFNYESELEIYERSKFTINPTTITSILLNKINKDFISALFCVFIYNVPIQLLINCEKTLIDIDGSTNVDQTSGNMNFNSKYNTIGKQFRRYSLKNKGYLKDYLNFLCGKQLFTEEFIINTLERLKFV